MKSAPKTLPLALVTLVTLLGCADIRLDENLCPANVEAKRTTLLLLDTSDPLSPKHTEELRRLVYEFKTPGESSEFYVAPGEAIVVYRLQPDLGNLKPIMRLCNPGDHPNSWSWRESLTQGRQIKLREWQKFDQALEALFSKVNPESGLDQSPILETLGVLAVRHAKSRREASTSETHMIVFSDLLQHSDALSHYGSYPQAAEIRNTAGLRHLHVDLSNLRISLFRLERQRDARFQTRDHYYWWTHLVQAFDGKVVRQESI